MIRLQLITLTGQVADKDIHELLVPTTAGEIVINGGHAPLLAAVAPGVLVIQETKQTPVSGREQLGVYDGTVEVLNNKITVLVDEVDTPEDVSTQEAEAAIKRAQEHKSKAGDAVSLAEAQAMIDRQEVRLKLAELKKSGKKRY